ncbi:peptidylprolyl isomerase [uncultured Ruminococcus sp.]|uniref:peptidylprolyl isomerase n=1 Tax=uncultured Ruminococcus sp. TaxID=165186 RepID=UPI0025D5E8AA|nr:peptidylprolyl isomerase [uncultured Ruminococcus sp.]
MLKKMTAMLLALTLCAGVLTGCGDKEKDKKEKTESKTETVTDAEDEVAGPAAVEEEEPLPVASLTVDGESIDTSNYVMCTIDGIDVTFDEFRFYYFYNLDSYKQNYGVTEESLRENDTAYKQFLDDVIRGLKQELVTDKLAAEYNIELDDEDQQIIDNNMQSAVSSYESQEAFEEDMQRAHLNEEIYNKLFVRAQTYNKVMDVLFANDGEFATKREDFLKLIQDPEEYAHEVHIMIPYYSQAELDDSTAEGYDDLTLSQKISAKTTAYAALDEEAQNAAKEKAKAVAEEALKRAKDGEDFFKLVEEYGWDIGLEEPDKGYYMERNNTGGYPEELLDATFSLKVGEVDQELVENSTYGYFIIKRIEPDMDYVNENIDSMISTRDQPAIQEKFNEIMDAMEVTYCDVWDKLTIDSIT